MQIPLSVIIGAVVGVALSIFLTFKMVKRQREGLQAEGKTLPSDGVIFAAGLVAILLYVGALVSAIMLILSPFVEILPAGSTPNATDLFTTLVLVFAAAGTAFYWLFVRLGILSWRAITAN